MSLSALLPTLLQVAAISLAVYLAIALGLIGINLLSWSGEFWAKWPLLAIAAIAGLHWFSRRRTRDGRAR